LYRTIIIIIIIIIIAIICFLALHFRLLHCGVLLKLPVIGDRALCHIA